MSEQGLYRELVAWLRANHPLILAQWEGEQKRRGRQMSDEKRLLRPARDRFAPSVDQLSPDADSAVIVSAIQQELESLGIGGGTPGVNEEGVPCVHLMKKGLYGRAYEESVTLARIRDPGYRRYLRQVFG